MHSTQRLPLQCGVCPLHCVSEVHCTQRPVTVLQCGSFPPMQFVSLRHVAQTPASVLQSGVVPPPQSPFVMHAWRQLRDAGSQTGACAGHVAALRHPTHVFAVVSQTRPFGHVCRQPTHVPLAVSQTGVEPPQSPLPAQPLQ